MAKNQLAALMKKAKDEAYTDGFWDGMQFGMSLAAIAINHKLKKGEQTIKMVEEYVNELIYEIVDMNEPEQTRDRLLRSLRQFRGADFTMEWRR